MYIVFLVLVIQHGSFSGNRTEVFPLGDQSSCTALWRRIETSRSEWRIGKWKKTSKRISWNFNGKCCVALWDSWDPARVEVPWWFFALGHTMGSQTRNRWKETAVLFLGVWNNWSIWSVPSCWSMTFLEDFCWGGRLTILWTMKVYLWRRIQFLRIMDKREKSWHLTNHLKINQRWIRRVWIN